MDPRIFGLAHRHAAGLSRGQRPTQKPGSGWQKLMADGKRDTPAYYRRRARRCVHRLRRSFAAQTRRAMVYPVVTGLRGERGGGRSDGPPGGDAAGEGRATSARTYRSRFEDRARSGGEKISHKYDVLRHIRTATACGSAPSEVSSHEARSPRSACSRAAPATPGRPYLGRPDRQDERPDEIQSVRRSGKPSPRASSRSSTPPSWNRS